MLTLFHVTRFLPFIHVCLAQTVFVMNYTIPQNCSVNTSTYFDALQLQCVSCKNSDIATFDHLNCKCPVGFIRASDGTCKKCEQGKKVSEDGYFCIECSSSENENDNQCSSCPFRYFTQRIVTDDGILMAQNCKKCPAYTKVSDGGDSCVPCLKTDDICQCQDSEICQKLEDNEMIAMIEFENGSLKTSPYISENIRRIIVKCSHKDIQACQHLANICVLQNYRTEKSSACTELETIIGANQYKHWNNRLLDIPTLFYYNSEPAIELSREAAIPARFYFNKEHPNSFLDIILIQFALNGTFLGIVPLSESDLNICSQQKDKFRFGVFYQMQCSFQLNHLLEHFGRQTIFGDIYIVFNNEFGQKQIYAMPILDENLRRNGEFVNRLTMDDISNSKWILTRRLYFFDSVTVNSLETGKNVTIIRFPEKINVRVQIQPQKDGRIMPPYVRIRHAEVSLNPEKPVSMQFYITYFMDGSKLFRDIEITLLVLAILSLIYAAISAYSWGRRSGKLFIDGATMIKFFFFECDILGDVLLFMILASAIFITYAYKAQQIPYYVVFNSKQEGTLISYLLIATVIKLISLVHRTAHLILTETFFIDWEQSHITMITSNRTIPTTPDISKYAITTTPPIIWRTYLIANEWNELQNYRKTSIGIQMIAMLAILQWLKVENWTAVAPGFHNDIPPSYASTKLSRLAITSSIYLALSITQWIFHVVIIERLVTDPFHNIIDLCSIANISVIALTHPLHGYYIHGRSVHGQADTDMAKMNDNLRKERESLCGERGLEPGSELQTFIVNLPKAFREQFDEAKNFMNYNNQKFNRFTTSNFDMTTLNIERIAKAHEQLNRFLMEFIERSNEKADYIIRESSLLEFLLDIEFADTMQTGHFVKDKSEMAFSGAFMYGNEWIYLSFELLLFNSVDYFTSSYSCSAFVTYVISTTFRKIASLFFTNHLIRSSFVDQRFLI